MLQQQEREMIYTYLIAAIEMTLSVLEGHSFIASLFQWDFSYIYGTSRGPSASAELLGLLTVRM